MHASKPYYCSVAHSDALAFSISWCAFHYTRIYVLLLSKWSAMEVSVCRLWIVITQQVLEKMKQLNEIN